MEYWNNGWNSFFHYSNIPSFHRKWDESSVNVDFKFQYTIEILGCLINDVH